MMFPFHCIRVPFSHKVLRIAPAGPDRNVMWAMVHWNRIIVSSAFNSFSFRSVGALSEISVADAFSPRLKRLSATDMRVESSRVGVWRRRKILFLFCSSHSIYFLCYSSINLSLCFPLLFSSVPWQGKAWNIFVQLFYQPNRVHPISPIQIWTPQYQQQSDEAQVLSNYYLI